ncbi:MAG: HPr family phosphocarrier protein [Phycisphaeraceae bacterium]|nr:MAG: HPr family phosphocarrier protein [Phycisphaeraceae bacterium]
MPDLATTTVKIVNKLGLHARPAMAFADTAGRFKASVAVHRGDQRVDGKSVMEIMLLAATYGTEIRIEAKGADAPECLAELRSLVERGFDEE